MKNLALIVLVAMAVLVILALFCVSAFKMTAAFFFLQWAGLSAALGLGLLAGSGFHGERD